MSETGIGHQHIDRPESFESFGHGAGLSMGVANVTNQCHSTTRPEFMEASLGRCEPRLIPAGNSYAVSDFHKGAGNAQTDSARSAGD